MTPATLVIPLEIGTDLGLEPLRPEHAASLFTLVDTDRDRLGDRLPWVAGTRSIDDTRAFIDSSMARRDTSIGGDGGGDWAIVDRGRTSTGGIVGVVGIHEVRWVHRRTSIGYWVVGDAEGRGLVSRSVASVARHLFGHGLHRLEIRAATDNHRSRAVAERCGFTLEGVGRCVEWIHERPIDHAVYGRLASDT